MDQIYKYESPLGGITLASDGRALIGLWLDGQKHFSRSLKDDYITEDLPIFEEAKRWLDSYFNGTAPDSTPRLDPRGTPFQKAVWDILLTIPYGATTTYGQIAEKISEQMGIPHMSAQAVGGAVNRNPISLIIPCHRVIGSDGSLTGYAGGIDKKAYLLRLEGAINQALKLL